MLNRLGFLGVALVMGVGLQSVWATEQIPDKLVCNGKTYQIPWASSNAFPLEPVISKNIISQNRNMRHDLFRNGELPRVLCLTTACYRGYVATWEAADGVLYLKSIEMEPSVHENVKGEARKADLKRLFPKRFKDGRVKADWFTGRLIGRAFPRERMKNPKASPPILLTVEKGKIVKNDITLAQCWLSEKDESVGAYGEKVNFLAARLIIQRREVTNGTLLLHVQVQFYNAGDAPLTVPVNSKTLKLQVVDAKGKPCPMPDGGVISGSMGGVNQIVNVPAGKESKRIDIWPAGLGISADAGALVNVGMGFWFLKKGPEDYKLIGTLTVPPSKENKNQWCGTLDIPGALVPLTRRQYRPKRRKELIDKLGKQMIEQDGRTAGEEAQRALSLIDDDTWVIPWYLKAMDVPRSSTRCYALDKLCRIDNPAVLPGLKKGMIVAENAVRHSAAIALARTPLPEGKTLLRKMEDDSYDGVRLTVLQTFASEDTPENRALLQRGCKDPDEDVRKEAQRLLKKLQQKSATPAKTKTPLIQKDTVDNVTLKAEYLPVYQAGRETSMKFTLKNTGETPVVYASFFRPVLLDIVVKNSKDKAAPLTLWGKRTMQKKVFSGMMFKKLSSGKSVDSNVNLARCYDLTIPGKYTAIVKWNSFGGTPENANTKEQKPKVLQLELKIEITEPE